MNSFTDEGMRLASAMDPAKPLEQYADAVTALRSHLQAREARIEELEKALEAHQALPKTPAEVHAFIWPDCAGVRLVNGLGDGFQPVEPHEDDLYSVTAHDLLSAFGGFLEIAGEAVKESVAAPQEGIGA